MKTLRVSAWKEKRLTIDAETLRKIEHLLYLWVGTFPPEPTWVCKNLGVHSLLIRVDFVLNGELKVYEIEERPGDIGITAMINPRFWQKFTLLFKLWQKELGKIAIVISERREDGDDYYWAELMEVPIFREVPQRERNLYLVRAEPCEKEYHCLSKYSISTVRHKGRKDYGEMMNLWIPVERIQELPWEKGFALKPRQGSKLQNLFLWDLRQRPGTSRREEIIHALPRVTYLQPWIEPEKSSLISCEYLIRKIFFAWNPLTERWESLGGIWVASNNLLFRTSDSIVGPIITNY